MAKRESRRQKRNWISLVLACVTLLFLALTSIQDKNGADGSYADVFYSLFSDTPRTEEASKAPADGELKVHFIDVGQGKSILIEAPVQTVLIDAGENNKGQNVLRYLSANGVNRLDIVVGTHPHSDHIGGLDDVIEGVAVESVIMPVIPDAHVPTGVTYTDVLHAIAEKNLKITPAKPGAVFDLGGGAKLTILGPIGDDASDLNDYSVVSRLDYGEVSFLFTGDATAYEERDLLDSERGLSADVLDVGHHGSTTSSSLKFLQKVAPDIAIISCGLDNSYGHPHREIVERLKSIDATILRTDLNGTIVISTDGTELSATKER